MFDRFELWLLIGLLAWIIFCALDAWITGLYRKNKEYKGEIVRLRRDLEEREQEVTWLKARAESGSDHRVLIRDQKIDGLKKELEQAYRKCKELETIINQKWKAVANDDIPVG